MLIVLAGIFVLAVAVATFSFGAAAYAPSSVLGERLKSLGFDRPPQAPESSLKERFDRILDPLWQSWDYSPFSCSWAPPLWDYSFPASC